MPIGPGASPLPERNENHTNQNYPVVSLSGVVGGGY
jgi:hypothetical protein